MKPLYDIRDQMPRFASNFFTPNDPDQIYPRVMTNPDTGKPWINNLKKEIVFHNEEEEKAFLAMKKTSVPTVEAPKAIDVLIAAPAQPSPPRHQFEALTPAEAEKAAEANETVRPKRKYTRKLSA